MLQETTGRKKSCGATRNLVCRVKLWSAPSKASRCRCMGGFPEGWLLGHVKCFWIPTHSLPTGSSMSIQRWERISICKGVIRKVRRMRSGRAALMCCQTSTKSTRECPNRAALRGTEPRKKPAKSGFQMMMYMKKRLTRKPRDLRTFDIKPELEWCLFQLAQPKPPEAGGTKWTVWTAWTRLYASFIQFCILHFAFCIRPPYSRRSNTSAPSGGVNWNNVESSAASKTISLKV